MQKRLVNLSVINDFTCLNCAIAQHELLAAVSESQELNLPLEFQIEFLPFRLVPTTVLPQDYQPKIQKADFYAKVMGQEKYDNFVERMSQWTTEKGIPLNMRGVVSQSTRAHRLSRKAFHMGGMNKQIPCLVALFRAHLEESQDIDDVNVLADVAASIGLMNRSEALAFFESDELEEEVNKMCDAARAQGITGVPLIVLDGKWALSGGQCSQVYLQIFKKLAGVHVASTLAEGEHVKISDCSAAPALATLAV